MKKTTSIILSVFLASTLLGNIAGASFSDVKDTNPYRSDIDYIQEKGIVSESIFSPKKPISRGDFARWILKNSGFNETGYKPITKKRFSDLPFLQNPSVYKLVDLGIVPMAMEFRPESHILKRDALNWLFSLEGIGTPKLIDASLFPIEDVNPNSLDAPLFQKAVEMGILMPGKALPIRKLTRELAAHYLHLAKTKSQNITLNIIDGGNATRIEQNAKFDILSEAYDRVITTYLRQNDINRDQLLYGAIEGIVKELGDKHSTFERPGDNSLMDSLSSEIEGIGAVLQTKDEHAVIVSPIAGSPADKAGLLPNDIIIEVDKVNVEGEKLSNIVARIKGKKGTQVRIVILRGEVKKEFVITRDVVKIVSVDTKWTEDNIAIVTLNSFSQESAVEFKKAVDQIVAKKAKGLLLDLRNNPGGYLDVAVTIAGSFIKKGDAVTTVRYPAHSETLRSVGNAPLATMKTLVLINSGSASASEILAGALQDYKLATVVGEQSYGKGTVQELQDFSDNSTLKLTIAEWLTPNERTIEKNGITPDIVVKLSDADRAAGNDPQKDRALSELRK